MRRPAATLGVIVFILFGPLVWAGYFLVIYGAHASLCAAGERLPLLDASALPLLLWGATAVALSLLAAGARWPGALGHLLRALPEDDKTARFVTRAMRLLTQLSLFGVGFAGIALTLVPLCAQLR